MIETRKEERALVMKNEMTKLVYSTEQSVPRKEHEKTVPSHKAASPEPRNVIVRLDRKGRGGKSVTLIEGLRLNEREKETLLKQLKARLGTGGALKNGVLEIQGDHCQVVMQHLQGMGCKPRRSGA